MTNPFGLFVLSLSTAGLLQTAATSPATDTPARGANAAPALSAPRLRLIKSAIPEYPSIAMMNHVTGQVGLHIVIGIDGHVVEAKPVSGPVTLQDAARQCVLQWVYEPVEQAGKPVRVGTTVFINFALQ